MGERYRLVTRHDFDGLVCAVLFQELDMLNEVTFAHPADMQHGKVPISERDIIANLPFVPGAHMTFDHHLSETLRVGPHESYIIDPDAPSAARVIFNHFGGASRFARVPAALMDAVDRSDSAQFTADDILHPQGWILLNFVLDPRTGLSHEAGFRVSDEELMRQLVDWCRDCSIDEILEKPDVKERIDVYRRQKTAFEEQIRRCAEVHKNLVVVDLRAENKVLPGNRFVVYALYPDCNISMQVIRCPDGQMTVFAIGKSILNRTSHTSVGALCLNYHGGGHEAAGTCRVPNDEADQARDELIRQINFDG